MALPPVKPNCPTGKIIGKGVAIDVNWDVCGDITDPTQLVFKPLGGMQSKGMQRSQETESVRDDRSVGDYDEVIGTLKTMTLSGNGFMNYTDGEYSNLVALDQLWAQEGPLVLHVRLTEPHATTYAYMIVTSYNRDFPTDTPITFELEFATTASGYGVMVVPTVPYVAPTSIEIDPQTLSLTVGQTGTLTSEVLPTGAPQSVAYSSSDAGVASVSAVGIVTAHSAGTATITASVPSAPSLTDTCEVTVTV